MPHTRTNGVQILHIQYQYNTIPIQKHHKSIHKTRLQIQSEATNELRESIKNTMQIVANTKNYVIIPLV